MTIEGAPLGRTEAAFIAEAKVAHLATVYPDGRPHVVPISAVLDLDRLVFATERDSQKVRNIEGDPNVSICFDVYDEDWTALRQVIVHGEAYVVDSGFEFERDRQLLYEAFPQYPTQAPIEEGSSVILEVRVDRVVSWGL